MNRNVTIATLLIVACAVGAAPRKTDPSGKKKPKAPPAAVSIAVLDYECAGSANKDQGSQIADILTARLSIEEQLQLVERSRLGKVLDEQKLKLTGLVNQDQAAQVGKLTGAKLLVIGRTFVMDKKLMIITKIVGVETGRVVGELRTVELSKPLSGAIMLLAEDIATSVRKNASKLLPASFTLKDEIADIRKVIGKGPTAAIAVIIPEEHLRRREPVPVADPAVETEIKKVLLACGYKIVDTGKNDLADWAKSMLKGKNKPWPAALSGADYVIVGEAFSEFALRNGDLVTCAGRAEINVIDRKTGGIIVADRHTTRAVDLAENIAGKTALQQAGHKLGLAVGKALAKGRKPAEAKKKTKESTR